MRIKSKVVSICTAALLTLTIAMPTYAATAPFTDLDNFRAKEKIFSLQERGYVAGIGGGLFAPSNVITAAESIALIVKALNINLDHVRFIKAPLATDYFTKANNEAWYANTLIIAAVNGLELPSDLDPSEEWTREQFTYQLIQAMEAKRNLPEIKLIPLEFADRDQVTAEYDGAIQRAFVYKLVQLDEEEKFSPKAKISRGQAAEQIYNALEFLKAHQA